MVCKPVECIACGKTFRPARKSQKSCSRECNSGGRPKLYHYEGRNYQERLINELKERFNFSSCMIDGCNYNKCYDLHRIKEGGEYIVGNAFAICPNHHAEIHRNIIQVEKVNDYTLIIVGE